MTFLPSVTDDSIAVWKVSFRRNVCTNFCGALSWGRWKLYRWMPKFSAVCKVTINRSNPRHALTRLMLSKCFTKLINRELEKKFIRSQLLQCIVGASREYLRNNRKTRGIIMKSQGWTVCTVAQISDNYSRHCDNKNDRLLITKTRERIRNDAQNIIRMLLQLNGAFRPMYRFVGINNVKKWRHLKALCQT